MSLFKNTTSSNKKAPTKSNKFIITPRDMDFLRKTLPHGLPKSSLYYKCGGAYTTVLIAYQYPSYADDLLFATLFNSIDAVVTLDLDKSNRHDQIRDVSRSIKELYSRSVINTDEVDNLNDRYELEDLTQLHRDLQKNNEQIITGTMRFYISADSEKELREKTEDIKKDLEAYGIATTVPENEMLYEYMALQDSANTVAQSFPIYQTLCRQYPFWHQSHKDPHGLFFGITGTGGQVILDNFLVSESRKSFDMLFLGKKGSGKSATLQDMIQYMVALGHKVMALDIEGTWNEYTAQLGGTFVRPGSKAAHFNPLQLRMMFSQKYDDTAYYEEESIDDLTNNFISEMSRVVTFFYQYIPSLSDIEADELRTLLDTTYSRFHIGAKTDLKRLKATDFPTFSNLLQTLREVLYANPKEEKKQYHPSLSANRIAILEKLESYIKSLAEGTYSFLFNGHSTIDVTAENLIVFDLSSISSTDPRVYNTYMYNVMGLMWSEIYRNRERNHAITDENDRRYCIAVLDEAHAMLNPQNPHVLSFTELLLRRARKYDAAMWFASQGPRDYAPSGNMDSLDKIRTIFSLVQYKCLLQQDESDFEILQQLFPAFTDSELLATSAFIKGEMLLSIGSGQKIRCRRYIPEEDFLYFGGGR